MKSLAVSILVIAAAACAATESIQKVPMPDPATVGDPAKARVFLFREDQTFGKAWLLLVSSASREIGALVPGNYLSFEASPGMMQFLLSLDRARFAGPPVTAAIPQRLEAGKTYYGNVTFDKDGPTIRILLDFLPESTGRERLAALSPAALVQ
jgi:hypothetical protein